MLMHSRSITFQIRFHLQFYMSSLYSFILKLQLTPLVVLAWITARGVAKMAAKREGLHIRTLVLHRTEDETGTTYCIDLK